MSEEEKSQNTANKETNGKSCLLVPFQIFWALTKYIFKAIRNLYNYLTENHRRTKITLNVVLVVLAIVLIAKAFEAPETVTVVVTSEVLITKEVPVTREVYIPVTVTPTNTPINSPTPTLTPTITSTPTITPTPTNTLTPTTTPTTTPTPNMTQTQQARINATQGAHATATRAAQYARATEIAQYEKISYKELVTYPNSHIGEMVWVEGRIFNINGNTELQMWLGWTYDAVYVVMREPFSGIYENDWIKVYGIVYGETCGTNAYGGEVCQPVLIDAFYEKP